jgi:putative SOS response-associated peptidase YedK
MCGRLVVSEPDLSVFVEPLDVRHVDAALLDQWQPRFNLAPTQLAPLVTNESERLTLAQFGLVPHWTKPTKLSSGRLINARVEGVASSRAFAHALVARRGIVPVTGYFEWESVAGKRRPIFIHATHGEPLFLASLWERWHAADGRVTQSFSVLTRPSIGALAPIHSRMPLTLGAQDVGAWLAPERRSADQLSRLLQAVPEVEQLALRRVSPLANSPRNDGPACIDEADDAAPSAATLETPQLSLFGPTPDADSSQARRTR